jgi:flagella basal body P-ring formation protein FlgA
LAVAALRPLARGQVIEPSDVQLAAFPARSASENLLHQVELAVGHEAVRPFAPGQPIDSRGLRKPLLVKRREAVRVTVLAPGVKLGTDGVALEDGSHGEWVLVDTPYSKEKIRARVAGPKQVELYAGGAQPPK